jgi:hypothetical protein
MRNNNEELLAFVHMEKAAGTSFIGALRQTFGVNHCDVLYHEVHDSAEIARQIQFARCVHPGLKSIASHNIRPQGISKDSSLHLMTFLRDPVKRSLSHYQYQLDVLHKPKSFDEWIIEPRFRNLMTRKLVDGEDIEAAKEVLRERFFFVGLVERFEESIMMLSRLSPFPLDIRIRRENVRRGVDKIEALRSDANALQALEEANKLDRELYRYVEKELWPRYQELAKPLPKVTVRRPAINRYLNRAYRNLIYKPAWKLLQP